MIILSNIRKLYDGASSETSSVHEGVDLHMEDGLVRQVGAHDPDLAVGDAHTNLLNPFWAIPLLAITGLRARDMFGYAITMMILLVPFLAIVLYVLPY